MVILQPGHQRMMVKWILVVVRLWSSKISYVDGVAYTDAIGFGSTAMTLPTADGSNGQVLVTDGGGALSWSSTAGNATRASTLTMDHR